MNRLETVPVLSCYEAGSDGFWIHRALEAEGIQGPVVDSASIEVNRRRRRAKSDGIDVRKLSLLLVRFNCGDPDALRSIHVPSEEEEDQRHLHRSLNESIRERTRLINRIKGLLVTQGIRLSINRDLPNELAKVRTWSGSPVPAGLKDRIHRVFSQWEFVEDQIRKIKLARSAALRESTSPAINQIRRLQQLKGIGENSSGLFVMEFFAWRKFRNRKEVGSLAGLTPTPYSSGTDQKEQGIGKDGNRHVRAMAVEIAWGWLRYQPRSDLIVWYNKRFSQSARTRRIGIVALARRMLIELWKYLETGELPAGAELKA